MALDTYTNLKIAIADYLDRDDLTSQIDDFIDLAEARMCRDVRIREQVVRAQATFDARYTALPDGFIQMRTLRLLTEPVTDLIEVNFDEMNRLRVEDNMATGRPSYFNIHEEIEVDITPDQDYTAEMIYWGKFTPLSGSNETNDLLTRAPDLYLYGSLLEAEPFLANDERLTMWSNLYQQGVDSLQAADRKSRYGGAIASQVKGFSDTPRRFRKWL